MIERMRGLERARADRAELARAEWLIWRAAAPIYSMRAMLQLVASVYAKMPSAQFDCSKMLFDLGGNVPWICGFAVVRTDGRVICATGAIDSRVAAAGEHRRPLTLMMIDIDHFKLFSDRYGHFRGDACLRAVGETLSLVTLEKAVVVARYSGEEFAFLLPGSMSGARPHSPKRHAGPSKTFS